MSKKLQMYIKKKIIYIFIVFDGLKFYAVYILGFKNDKL